ncbi:MAG: tape measure protein [Magnetococcales bacterium]|nr:tape measure protein [Magnetococcales bacterium]
MTTSPALAFSMTLDSSAIQSAMEAVKKSITAGVRGMAAAARDEAKAMQAAFGNLTQFERLQSSINANREAFTSATREAGRMGNAYRQVQDDLARMTGKIDQAKVALIELNKTKPSIRTDAQRAEIESLKNTIQGLNAQSADLRQFSLTLRRDNDLAGQSVAKLSAVITSESRELVRLGESLRSAGINTGSLVEAQRTLQAQMARTAEAATRISKLSGAKAVLGITIPPNAEREIDRLTAAFNRLERSGKLSASEIQNAYAILQTKIAGIRTGIERNSQTFKDFQTVGIRSSTTIQAEIERLKSAYARMAASGTISQQDLARASEAVTAKQAILHAELRRTGQGLVDVGSNAAATSKEFSLLGSSLTGLGLVIATQQMMSFGKATVEAGLAVERAKAVFFATTGTVSGANKEFNFAANTANNLGQSIATTAIQYGKFAVAAQQSGISANQTKDIFLAFSQAGTAMKLTGDAMGGIFRALTQLSSKGVVQLEELSGQLGEHLPGALALAAKAMGVTQVELRKMSGDGELLTNDLLPRLAVTLKEEFGEAAKEAAEGAEASFTRFNNSIFMSKNTMAQEMMPTLGEIAKQITKSLNGTETQEAIKSFGKGVGDTIKFLFDHREAVITVGAAYLVWTGGIKAANLVGTLISIGGGLTTATFAMVGFRSAAIAATEGLILFGAASARFMMTPFGIFLTAAAAAFLLLRGSEEQAEVSTDSLSEKNKALASHIEATNQRLKELEKTGISFKDNNLDKPFLDLSEAIKEGGMSFQEAERNSNSYAATVKANSSIIITAQTEIANSQKALDGELTERQKTNHQDRIATAKNMIDSVKRDMVANFEFEKGLSEKEVEESRKKYANLADVRNQFYNKIVTLQQKFDPIEKEYMEENIKSEEEYSKKLDDLYRKRENAVRRLGEAQAKEADAAIADRKKAIKKEEGLVGEKLRLTQKDLTESLNLEKKYESELEKLLNEKWKMRLTDQQRLGEIRRKNMTETQSEADKEKQAVEMIAESRRLASEARKAYDNGDIERGNRLAKQSVEIANGAKDIASELKNTGKGYYNYKDAMLAADHAQDMLIDSTKEQLDSQRKQTDALERIYNSLENGLNGLKEAIENLDGRTVEAKAQVKTEEAKRDIENIDREIMKLDKKEISPKLVLKYNQFLKDLEDSRRKFNETLNSMRNNEIVIKIKEVRTPSGYQSGGHIGYARGGHLPGYGGGDRIHALLEAGEFVVRKEAVGRYGAGMLHAINSMRADLPRFGFGGMVMPEIPEVLPMSSFAGAAPGAGSVERIDIRFNGTPVASQQDPMSQLRGLVATLKGLERLR